MPGGLPHDMVIEPLSRRPLRLPQATVDIANGTRFAIHAPAPAPVASIVMVTHDNLAITRLCLSSLLGFTETPPFEVVVVDNASTDGSARFLEELAARDRRVRPVLNDANLGFAAATNIGIGAARGAVMVMLNNDTIVAPGWLARLLRHLEDREVGLVGPLTNQAPNQSRLATSYTTMGGFLDIAAGRLGHPDGTAVAGLTLFCVAARRDVIEQLGPLDERFEVGMFEDDDLCARAVAAGYRLRLAEDVFVHHFGEASFGSLVPTGEYQRVFEANRRRFEAKWGRAWAGHQPRDDPDYLELIGAVVEAVARAVPAYSRVLVISRGDERLLAVPGRTAGHFPQDGEGEYAGSYPGTDAEAIAQVSALRQAGWDYLAVPPPAAWWLDHYPGFAAHLQRGGLVAEVPGAGRIFALPALAGPGGPAVPST